MNIYNFISEYNITNFIVFLRLNYECRYKNLKYENIKKMLSIIWYIKIFNR